MKKNATRRVFAGLLALALLLGYFPGIGVSAEAAPDLIETVADPETLTRPEAVYGDNTLNAGKITLGKSVEAAENGTLSITVNNQEITGDPDNFLVTLTQTAQVMGLTSENAVPLDVVFVLDASNSMTQSRRRNMVSAANEAIATLMAANENNRVAVVAFSGVNSSYTSATTLLSPLDHYTGEAATAHLRWSNANGTNTGTQSNSRNYILGRSNSGNAGIRNANSAGTNLQAGIAAGARVLTATNNTTTVTVDGTTMTRMPFLVVLSDGAASCHSSSATWYDPDNTNQGAGSVAENLGSGFIAATTAAYYKSLITEKYYGTAASKDNCATIYTIGVEVSNAEVAQMAINPLEYFVETNTSDNYETFKGWWDEFLAEPAANFNVAVNSNRTYTYTAASINAARDRVLGKSSTGATMYTGGLAYNDDYFDASSADEIVQAFRDVVAAIQLKAISAPTKVTESGADFSGYVNFYDTLGEYMEVKEMKGIVANGNYYQGRTFANLLMNPGTNTEFDSTLQEVLTTRLALSESNVNVNTLLTQVRANKEAMNDTTNSFCWWGKEYDVGEEDTHMQLLGAALDDSISYIENANNGAPADATYVCRSYFFYGTAGNTVQNPNHEYLYFVVRVQRSLEAPYQQTVVVSVPASLLSVERVTINEDVDGNFTAQVTEVDPTRVVYEVGLRSDINAQNVKEIVSSTYTNEATVGAGSVNYDDASDTYYFFTNDWNHGAVAGTHQRAMTKATFDAAADNSFYAYQEDTVLLVLQDGNYVPYTGTTLDPSLTYYYARTYYDWAGTTAVSGSYPATEKTAYIAVSVHPDNIASEHFAVNADGQWYVKKGTYTASTTVAGDETAKTANTTGTAANVKYVNNTTGLSNSHYTVMLGNNGRLALTADTTKTVSGTRPTDATIQIEDGSYVMIGDVLTYTIKVVNNTDEVADATVTDTVPKGTKFLSATPTAQPDANGVLTWTVEDIPAGQMEYVSFQVEVTEAVLDEAVVSVDNTATVQIGNNPAYDTNTTHNPPSGKVVLDVDSQPLPEEGVQVGDELIYRIRYVNDHDTTASVTITDIVPEGTKYLVGTGSPAEYLTVANNTLTWVIPNVPAGGMGVVSFRVVVDASAKVTVENDATIQVGENDPGYKTNPTETKVQTGLLKLTKTVTVPEGYTPDRTNDTFTIHLSEAGGDLVGEYDYILTETGKDPVNDKVTFTAGKATLTIKHGQSILIQGLPAGANIAVVEGTAPGYTVTYTGLASDSSVDIPVGAVEADAAVVTVTNQYTVAPVALELTGTKTLEGTLVNEVVFTFTAQRADSTGAALAGYTPVVATAVFDSTTGNSKTFTFGANAFVFTNPGTYYYLITETQSGVTGVTYDQTQYLLTVVVEDKDSNGQLTATYTLQTKDGEGAFTQAATTLTFKNTYVPNETALTLEGTKTLVGRDLKDGEFRFLVQENGVTVATGYNVGNKIVFQEIVYKAPGTHTYTVTEVLGTLPGVTYDTNSYTVTVTVTDENGQLVTTVSYPAGAAGVSFTNTYVPTEVSVNLEAQKVLTGGTLAAGDFSFQVIEVGATTPAAEGINDGNGHVTFSAIGYTLDMLGGADSKTFVYQVKEIEPDLAKIPFVQYSKELYTVEVTVSYDASTGLLSVDSIVYKDADGNVLATGVVPTFTNVVNDNSVTITPADLYKQTLGDNAPSDAIFSFSIVDMDGNVVATGQNEVDTDGDHIVPIDFSSLTYTKAPGTYDQDDVYYYWVKETNAASGSAGIDYDTTRYLLKVTVSYNETEKKLVATQEYYAFAGTGEPTENIADYTVLVTPSRAEPNFTNTYKAEGMITVSATKVMTGRTLADREFGFVLEPLDPVANPDAPTLLGYNVGGTVTFANLYYSNESFPAGQDERTIIYVMREIEPEGNKLPGVTYDKTVYYVKVVLTHDTTAGDILTTVTYHSDPECTSAPVSPVFNNAYLAKNVTLTIDLTKELSGRDMAAEEFSFQLLHYDPDTGTETPVVAATNTQSGATSSVQFKRTYYAETFPAELLGKPIYYLIRETVGGQSGVTYSDAVFGVKVTIVDDTTKGELVISEVVYYEGDDFTTVLTDTSALKFVNEYEAGDASYTPVATKVLNGRDMTRDNEFSFLVKTYDPTTKTAGTTVSVGQSKQDGTVVFDAIHYTDKPGTYTETFYYEISEVQGTLGGVTYSTAKYYLVVKVQDTGAGKLTVTATYYSDDSFADDKIIDPTAVKFVNTYKTETGVLQLKANKTLVGRSLVEGEFIFVVIEEGKTEPVAWGTNDANGNVIFGSIQFTQPGVYKYSIYEQKPGNGVDNGVTYSDAVYTVTVTVTDNGDGTLSIVTEGIPEGGMVFTNTYEADELEVQFSGWKYLTNKHLAEGEFSFTITGPGYEKTVTNAANGEVKFPVLKFTEKGTYTYLIKETGVNPSETSKDGTYVNDTTIYKVTVTVTDDLLGKLHATITYEKSVDGGTTYTAVDAMEFVNSYAPPVLKVPLSLAIGATKTLDGRVLAEGEFKFRVIDITGAVKATGYNKANGEIVFTDFVFDAPGIYNYRVEEILEDENGNSVMPGGVTGDARQWRVQIHVRYDETKGILYINPQDHAEPGVIVRDLNNNPATPTFENTYETKPVSVAISVSKQLVGRPLEAGEFLFQLWEGSVLRDEIYNGGEGHVNFNLTYHEPGVHVYTIKEAPGNKPGVTYSQNVETVTVTVIDNGKGQLVASVKFSADSHTDGHHVFVNTYAPADGVAEIQVKKLVQIPEGSSYVMSGGEFSFQLLDENGNVIDTQTNDTNGYVTFKLTYKDEDLGGDEKLYHYTVVEVVPTEKLPGMTYDTTEHDVDVLVTDNYSGQLVTKVTYLDDNEGYIVFTNKYEIQGVGMVEIPGIKSYVDDKGNELTLEAGAFSFGLYQDGQLVGEAVKNAADGSFSFVLSYELKDIGVHEYVIKEIVPGGANPSITYDPAVYELVVTVADNRAGGLSVTYTLDGKADGVAEFENVYTEPDPLNVTIDIQKKVMNNSTPGIGLDGFVMVLEQTQSKYTKTTGTDGKVGYTLTFGVADIGQTYVMKVYEQKGTAHGVTYDTTVYTLTIEIGQNADGSLKAIINGKETNKVALEFTNTYTAPGTPPTGDNSMIYPMLAMMGLSALGCVLVLMLLMQKKRYGGKY